MAYSSLSSQLVEGMLNFTFVIQPSIGGESFNFIKVQVEVECIAVE
jgi:hypothetical protein